MAAKPAPEMDAPPPAADAPAARPKGKFGLVGMISVISIIIVAQVVITWFLMPKAVEAKPGVAPVDAATKAPDDELDSVERDAVEVNVGDFNCTNATASPGVVMHVDFKLTAVTVSNRSSQLEKKLKENQARVRQLVSKIVRKSSIEDLNDPNLGTIKREVREEINRLLHKSLVEEVIMSDVRTMEQ